VCSVMLLNRGSCGGCVQSCCLAAVPVVGVFSHVAWQRFCSGCVQSCCLTEVPVVDVFSHVA